MSKRERLSGADNAWRRMGKSDNLTTITGVLSFNEEITYEELCQQMEERLLRFDRFKQCLGGRKRKIRRPYWELVEEFDLDSHVHDIALPEPKDRAQLQKFVGTLMSRPLDERRPLWEAFLIREFEEGSAVVVRLNHSMADGFALLYVLFGLADNPEEIEFPIGGLSTPPAPDDTDTELSEGESAAAETDTDTTVKADGQGAVVEPPEEQGESEASLQDESEPEEPERSDSDRSILKTLRNAGTAAKAGVGLLAMSNEPQTSLHDDIGIAKRAAWTDEMDLDAVKEIGEAHDTTINDVLLAATASVFHRTLESRGEDTEDMVLRCTVPVNLKPMDKRDETLGNHFGLSFVPIPVSDMELDERIRFIRKRTSKVKLGTQAYITNKLLNIGGTIPEPMFNLALNLFQDNATAVVSNVPGPMDSIEIAGKEVEKIMFWNPQALDQGLSVSIFTYNGGVRVGVSGDAKLIPEPEELTDTFEDEIDELIERYT